MAGPHIHRNSGGNVDLTQETMLEGGNSLLYLHLQIGSVSCVLVFSWMSCVSPTMTSVTIWHRDHPSGTMMPSELIPPTDVLSSPMVINSTTHENHHLATPQKTFSLLGLKLSSSSLCRWALLFAASGPHFNQTANSPTDPHANSCLWPENLSSPVCSSLPRTCYWYLCKSLHSPPICFSYHFHSHFPLDL